MTLRAIAKITYSANTEVKVSYNSDLREYVAKLYIEGKHYEPADAFEDDKESMLGTAHTMAMQAARNDARIKTDAFLSSEVNTTTTKGN